MESRVESSTDELRSYSVNPATIKPYGNAVETLQDRLTMRRLA
ncbi:MAG: hypothetical protein ABSB50_05835 [Terracidiphilus sp.]